MLTEIFNLVEGVWWIGLGCWGFRTRFIEKTAYRVGLSATLVLFGISDFIEIFTGAWWEPVGLLVFKAVCITAGIIFLILIFSERRQP